MALAYGGRHFAGRHLESGANDPGLDPGHGRDVPLGHALETGQLLDGHGFFGRGQALPVVVLDQHPGQLVDGGQVVADKHRNGRKTRLDGRVLAALTGDDLQPTVLQLTHQGRVEHAQSADGRRQALTVTVWPPGVLRIVDQRGRVYRSQFVALRCAGWRWLPTPESSWVVVMVLPFSLSGAVCPGSGHRPQPVTLLGTQASERSCLGVT